MTEIFVVILALTSQNRSATCTSTATTPTTTTLGILSKRRERNTNIHTLSMCRLTLSEVRADIEAVETDLRSGTLVAEKNEHEAEKIIMTGT